MIGQEYLAKKLGEKAVKEIGKHDKDVAEKVERTVTRGFSVLEIVGNGPLFVTALLLNLILMLLLLIIGPFENGIGVLFLLLLNFACVLFAINTKDSLRTIRHGVRAEQAWSQAWAYCFRKAALATGIAYTLAALLHYRSTAFSSLMQFFVWWGVWLVVTLVLNRLAHRAARRQDEQNSNPGAELAAPSSESNR